MLQLYITDDILFYRYFPFFSVAISLMMNQYLVNLGFIKNINIGTTLVSVAFFLILSSYSEAKIKARLLIENDNFQYVNQHSEFRKVIGVGGEYVFTTSLNNNGITYQKVEKTDSTFVIMNYPSPFSTEDSLVKYHIDNLINISK